MKEALVYALASKLDSLKKKTKIVSGSFQLDELITLKVTGTVRKGEDETYVPTVDIPLLSTMALFLEKSGFQRERSIKLLAEAMVEAINMKKQGKELVEGRIKDIEQAMKHVERVIGKLPAKVRSGKTLVNVVLEEVKQEKV